MLEVREISKTFHPGTANEKTALSNLSLRLEPVEFVTVIGINRCVPQSVPGSSISIICSNANNFFPMYPASAVLMEAGY